jgi:chromosome segregation ATPase
VQGDRLGQAEERQSRCRDPGAAAACRPAPGGLNRPASLRADLANAKAANHRLTTELAALRRRLGQLLGQDALAGLDHATIDTNATSARLAQLEQALFEAAEQLAQRTEELEAARQINRELIARLNGNVADHEAERTPVPRRP